MKSDKPNGDNGEDWGATPEAETDDPVDSDPLDWGSTEQHEIVVTTEPTEPIRGRYLWDRLVGPNSESQR